jgi:hypothetical protein
MRHRVAEDGMTPSTDIEEPPLELAKLTLDG